MNCSPAFIDHELEGSARVAAGSISVPHFLINTTSPQLTGCGHFGAGNVERVVTRTRFFKVVFCGLPYGSPLISGHGVLPFTQSNIFSATDRSTPRRISLVEMRRFCFPVRRPPIKKATAPWIKRSGGAGTADTERTSFYVSTK